MKHARAEILREYGPFPEVDGVHGVSFDGQRVWFVTGVTWVDGELWHGTWQDEASDVRRIDPGTGKVLERLEMPAGTGVSGLESDGNDRFFCGGGNSGRVTSIRRPRSNRR